MPDREPSASVESYQTPKFLNGVIFVKKLNRQGQEEWVSDHPTYKHVVLEANFPHQPEPGIPYEVEIIQDSNPGVPDRGVYIVRLVEEKEEYLPLATRSKEREGKISPIEIDYERNKVYILESELDYNPEGGPLVPSSERFRHFTLDQNTLETLETIATAISLRQPCFLEGDTATSKTSAIEYLAMLTNNEVIRFNFNGQTDTSEMIGKFVPNDGQLQIEYESLIANRESLTGQSRIILDNADRESRQLTQFESQKIASLEGLAIPEWRWQDGAVPVAMRKKVAGTAQNGAWLIYDEYGLGDPSVRERTNSVLEKTPVLVLSENGGAKIGGEGDQIGENFRLFGTNNPDYAGRYPLTPADRDRWTISKGVKPPTEADYGAMATLMIFGEQPKVTIHGKEYQADTVEPLLPKLSRIEGIREFIAKAAKFHSEVARLAQTPGTLRRGSKETYTFTRRGFAEFLSFIENRVIVDRHAGRRISIETDPKTIILRGLKLYYIDKIQDPNDQKKVTDQMDAIGISESKWLINLTPPKETTIRYRTTPPRPGI